VDPSGRRVAVASECVRVFVHYYAYSNALAYFSELSVKIIDLDEITNVVVLQGGHKKRIRKTTWHPLGSILVRALNKIYITALLMAFYSLDDK
jgi:chromosome transmission fidelity protein 4